VTGRAGTWLALASALGLCGCGKTNDPNDLVALGGGASSSGAGSLAGADSVQPGGAGGSGGDGAANPAQGGCTTEGPSPGPSPLTALASDEVNATLRALFPQSAAWSDLPWLPDVGIAYPQPPRPEQVHELAHAVALRVTDDRTSGSWLAGCDVAKAGEVACRDALGEPFLERAYRRPLVAEDRADMASVFAAGRELGGDFASGMRAVVQAALESADFLYLVAQGSGSVVGDAVELTGYETAARLSYFLTRQPPDDALLKAAAVGPFDRARLAEQAQRLLGTQAARRIVSRYYAERLRLNLGDSSQGDAPLTTELRLDIEEASRRFIEHVAFEGDGTLRALLTQSSVWANGRLSRFYGYGLEGDGWQQVQLDPQRYAGVFTQPAALAWAVSAERTSPVQRGLRVLTGALCFVPDPPPVGIGIVPDEFPADATTREHLEISTQAPECRDCHRIIDPVGFAFEHLDGVGRFRDNEKGRPIDTSGRLEVTDAQGPFSGAVELMQRIAASDAANACFAQAWLELAYRRPLSPKDACTQQQVVSRFAASDGKIVDLLVEVALGDSFRYRLRSELGP
jgi:Protein of unknown function (DUF1588)/Protein of unknown function (DUF1592)/Protein of unknown function (DUF1585)/Protein of unknown function (DUF1595)